MLMCEMFNWDIDMGIVDLFKVVEIRNLCLREMQSDIFVFELLSLMFVVEFVVKIVMKSGLVKLDVEVV